MLSGGAVGFSLGLIGGGGSILAVPLLLYVVGIGDPHVAIGTSALSVAANAFANLLGHWRAGNVKWPCAATFALAGILGAAIGSTIGKLVDGQQLLFLFALAMIVVGVAMLRPRAAAGNRSRSPPAKRRSTKIFLPSSIRDRRGLSQIHHGSQSDARDLEIRREDCRPYLAHSTDRSSSKKSQSRQAG